VLLCIHVFGFFVFLLTFWIMADHAPASRVFTQFKYAVDVLAFSDSS
jgi:hypothetical protein